MGDFVFYSVLVARAALYFCVNWIVCMLAVLMGTPIPHRTSIPIPDRLPRRSDCCSVYLDGCLPHAPHLVHLCPTCCTSSPADTCIQGVAATQGLPVRPHPEGFLSPGWTVVTNQPPTHQPAKAHPLLQSLFAPPPRTTQGKGRGRCLDGSIHRHTQTAP